MDRKFLVKEQRKGMKEKIKKVGKVLGILLILGIFILFSINILVKQTTKKQIVQNTIEENYDAILVLGAGIWGDKPSPMLEDRLLTAISLYEEGASQKIIMSGDHGRKDYDEVNLMKNYGKEKGIPSENIFMDHAGFSTYESLYRAKEIFGVKKIIIVTQKYHLYRSLYIANKLGIEAVGVPADIRTYAGQAKRELREMVARGKDLLKCILKPKPTYLGESIPINGSGDVTNDS